VQDPPFDGGSRIGGYEPSNKRKMVRKRRMMIPAPMLMWMKKDFHFQQKRLRIGS